MPYCLVFWSSDDYQKLQIYIWPLDDLSLGSWKTVTFIHTGLIWIVVLLMFHSFSTASTLVVTDETHSELKLFCNMATKYTILEVMTFHPRRQHLWCQLSWRGWHFLVMPNFESGAKISPWCQTVTPCFYFESLACVSQGRSRAACISVLEQFFFLAWLSTARWFMTPYNILAKIIIKIIKFCNEPSYKGLHWLRFTKSLLLNFCWCGGTVISS